MTKRAWLISTAALAWALAVTRADAQTPGSPTAQANDPQTQGAVNPAEATGASADAAVDEDTIVVTGFRRTIARAAQIKRDAPQIVDSIVAEDIGKLPDLVASDTLARVPGVTVERANGEASRVLLRGLDLYTTTYNGRDIFTAEARRVAIQDFPAGGVQALEAYKSTTADQIEGGVAGLINVRSFRPFDFREGFVIAGEVRGTYATQSERIDPNGNILLSARRDTKVGEIGALINFNWLELNYLDSARFVGGGFATSTPAQSAGPAFTYPDFVGIFYSRGDRARPSINGTVQWQATDKLEVYFDALWQGFRRQRADRLLGVPISRGGDGVFSNVTLIPGSSNAQSLSVRDQTRPELFQAATYDYTNTSQFAVGARYASDRFKASVDLARTETKFDLSVIGVDTAFAQTTPVNVNFDVPRGDGGVEFSFPGGPDLNNPATFITRGLFQRRLIAKGDDYQARADFSLVEPVSFIRSLDIGFRFTDRFGSRTDDDNYNFTEPRRIPLASLPLELEPFHPGFRGSDIQPVRQWVQPTYRSIRDNIGALQTQLGSVSQLPRNPFNEFQASEKSYAGYIQAQYQFGPVAGVVGVRANQLDRSIESVAGVVDTSRLVWLPTANLKWNVTRDLIFRFSFTKTRTEPDYGQLAPNFTIPSTPGPSGRFEVGGGNPFLQPYDAFNYDVILEYYPSRTTNAAVGLFRRDVSNFIVNRFEDVDFNGLPLRITGPINLNEVTFQGIEAQLTAFLDYDWAPDWARGIGVQLNGTYIDTTVQGGATRLDRTLGGQSDFTYNAIAIYERGPIAARLAYNWRGGFVDFGNGTQVDPIGRLDFTLNVTPWRDVTVFAFGNNVLGAPFRNFDLGGVYPRDVRYEETIYGAGVRFRLTRPR